MKNNNQFAHRLKESSIENFYKVIFGEKKNLTKREEAEFEASYFAMCLLLPKDIFLNFIDALGGIKKVKSNRESINCLARVFQVEEKLVEARIQSIFLQENEVIIQKKKIK